MVSENLFVPSDEPVEALTRQKGRVDFTTILAVVVAMGFLVILLLPSLETPRSVIQRNACANNLHKVVMALLDYENVHHALPPAYTVDANGKPLHSWRTLILPYLDQQSLFDTIDLSKPWDDPANSVAFHTRLDVYRCPSASCPENHTTYLANAAANGCFRAARPTNLSDITDDQHKTLMVMEVVTRQSVHWMSPNDASEATVLGFGQNGTPHPDGMNAEMCDGSYHFIFSDMPATDRRAMISIANGDKFDFP